MEISCKPINIFLDFNAVIVNIDSLSKDTQKLCLANIESNVQTLKSYLEENMTSKKMFLEIPGKTGIAAFGTTIYSHTGNRNMDCVNEKERFKL